MMIPSELLAATQHDYYSWVMPIESTDSPFTFYQKVSPNHQKPNMYWETPDQTTSFCAYSAEMIVNGQQASVEDVKNFSSNVSLFQGTIDGQLPEATGCIFVGGFSFDQADKRSSETWGPLAQGYFFIPTFILTQHNGQTFLTINIKQNERTTLTKAWQTRYEAFRQLQKNELPSEEGHSHIMTEEVATEDWVTLVDETVAQINSQAELTKVVLARETAVKHTHTFSPTHIIKQLKQQQQSTYFFGLSSGTYHFIGATPERLLKATTSQWITASIAGSTPRGRTALEDEQLGQALLHDTKNRQEHLIVVKRIIKDLEKITQTKIAIQEPSLLKNRDIQHLHLPITAKRTNSIRFLEVVEQLHPTPALGGEPKSLALEWLRKKEPLHRGLYGAPVGWYHPTTDLGEFAVGIRSGVFHEQTGRLFAGCGIVADSDSALERIETSVKFRPMLRGIGGQLDDTSN